MQLVAHHALGIVELPARFRDDIDEAAAQKRSPQFIEIGIPAGFPPQFPHPVARQGQHDLDVADVLGGSIRQCFGEHLAGAPAGYFAELAERVEELVVPRHRARRRGRGSTRR